MPLYTKKLLNRGIHKFIVIKMTHNFNILYPYNYCTEKIYLI